MDVETYAVPYVAGWAEGDSDRVRDSFARVVKVASTIVPEPGAAAAFPAQRRRLASTTADLGVDAPWRSPDGIGRETGP